MECLQEEAAIAIEKAERAEEHHILAQLGDVGQHSAYRKASATWEDPRWMVGGFSRQRLQDDLGRGDFGVRFRSELSQLIRDLNAQLNASLSPSELASILDFVHRRHTVSHAGLTEANTVEGVLGIISSAKGLCERPWPPSIERHRRPMVKAIAEYEETILAVHGLSLAKSDMVLRSGRYTGWLWEISRLVEETKERREREKEKEREGGEGKKREAESEREGEGEGEEKGKETEKESERGEGGRGGGRGGRKGD